MNRPAYLAALGLMGGGGDSAAPTTGPQPVPLTNDGGPLGTAPSTARALDLTPDGHGEFGDVHVDIQPLPADGASGWAVVRVMDAHPRRGRAAGGARTPAGAP